MQNKNARVSRVFLFDKKIRAPRAFLYCPVFLRCAARARPPRYNPFLYSSSFVVCFEFLLYW